MRICQRTRIGRNLHRFRFVFRQLALSGSPNGTTPTVGTSPVTVNISSSALIAGTYSGTVSVTQNPATVIVPVNLTVTAPFTPSVYDVSWRTFENSAES